MFSAQSSEPLLVHSALPKSYGFVCSLLLHLGLIAAIWFSGYASFLRARSTKPKLFVIELSEPSGALEAKPAVHPSKPKSVLAEAKLKPKKDSIQTTQDKAKTAQEAIQTIQDTVKTAQAAPAAPGAAVEQTQTLKDDDKKSLVEDAQAVSEPESVSHDMGHTGLKGGLGGTRAMTLREQYLAEILSLIERQKFYPNDARIRRETGSLEVTFSILADGSIAGLELTRPSAFVSLNRAGVSILQKIGRFPPIPNELHEREIRLTVPIEYGLR